MNIDKYFDKGYIYATEYFKANNNLYIPKTYKTEDNYGLGVWIVKMRTAYNKNELSQPQIEKLNSINMTWSLLKENSAFEISFANNLKLFRNYIESNGSVLVPHSFVISDVKLGEWIAAIRSAKRGVGQYKNKLLQKHIDTLDSLGMVWDVLEDNWDTQFNKAKLIADKHGSILDGNIYRTNGDESLRRWLNSQKSDAYETLTDSRKEKLESIGMIFDSTLNTQIFDKNINLLKEYISEFKDSNVPDGKIYKNENLGYWVQRQRKKYKNGLLLPQEVDTLESIGFIWNVNKVKWEDMISCLRKAIITLKTTNIPSNYVLDDIPIGRWLSVQRTIYRKNQLPFERYNELSSLGISWDVLSQNSTSFNEQTILFYIKKVFNDAIGSVKPVWLNNKELDIFIPSLNIGIEYDGERWHKDIKTDENKNNLCKSAGVNLIRVREPGCPSLDNCICINMSGFDKVHVENAIFHLLNEIYKLTKITIDIDIDINRDYADILAQFESCSLNAKWEEMYELCKEYVNEFGDLLVPQNCVYKERNLGTWIMTQRSNYTGKTRKYITPEHIKKLEEIGMVWNVNEYNR